MRQVRCYDRRRTSGAQRCFAHTGACTHVEQDSLVTGSGATLVGLALAVVALGPSAKVQAVNLLFMGWGFYMIHGCLQVFASELSVEARATALSLHSFFFFMGQTVGPIAYGFGLAYLGKIPTLLISAAIMIAASTHDWKLTTMSR